MQSIPAAAVNHLALAVHHIVILQQALADAKVVLLHLALGALNGLGDHGVLNHFPVLVAQTVHHLGHPFTLEQAHQVVFQAHIELAASGVALAA